MNVDELRKLIRWCDYTGDNAGFRRRMYFAAFAFDLWTQLLIQVLIATCGILPNFYQETI